jgi:hypothetical protein
MYDIYGDESFIASQITWLNADLAAAGDMNKVLFYHYDFKGELDLSSLGVDMALWGHNHSNTGSIYSHPYNLSTAATCNGNRAYRLIRVNGNDFQPEYTVKTHDDADMLTLDYNMVNDGSLDLVSATIKNNHNLSFNKGLIKFVMPISDFGYYVTNGSLLQVLENGSVVVCYVEVSISANGQITTTIEKKTSTTISDLSEGESAIEFFPNPFTDEINIRYEIRDNSDVFISLHNLKGELIKVLVNEHKKSGKHELKWNAANSKKNKVKSGTYIYKYMLNGKHISSGQILLIK